MYKSWTQGLDPELVKDIRADFKSSLITRRRLAAMLRDKIDEQIKLSLAIDNYEVANWSHKVADNHGYIRALRFVIDLIEDKDTNNG